MYTIKINYFYCYLCVCLCTHETYIQVTKEARESIRFSVAEVTGSCELPHICVGSRTQILSRGSKHS